MTSSIATSPITYLLATFHYANGVKGSTNGFEIAPDWRPVSWWQFKGSYSYLRLDLKNEPGNADTASIATYEGSSPHHQIMVQSRFNLLRRLEFDQTYRYVSALPAQTVPAYLRTSGCTVGWHPAQQWELSVTGENLLQPRHTEFANDPLPNVAIKRSVYANITWTHEAR